MGERSELENDPAMEEMFDLFEAGGIQIIMHFVIWTAGCEPSIDAAIRERLHEETRRILERGGSEPLAVGGTGEHLHALARISPERSMDEIARELLAMTAEWIGWQVPGFAWVDDYAAFTLSPWEAGRERDYIERQEEHHRTETFREELERLLTENGIEFSRDELWK
jgi:hypothetical protein